MSRRRALLLGPLAALCGLILMVAVPQSAQAFSDTGKVTVAANSSYCVKADAHIDHLTPGLLSGDQASSGATAYAADCATPVAVRARSRLDLQFWNEPGQVWITCLSTDWAYGTTGSDQWGPTGPGTLLSYGGPACGPGWYRTRAYAYVYLLNLVTGGYWYGGSTTGAYEWADQ
ncbi:hypothetical protein [Streptomyces sp. NBC_01477]|uniref:hypothetical protein n=1 Tax=Streptomyces sp. NBC_01477 TaxID=2976015 RepID=UPI002E3486E1|nr:hypothetical protein [Streptomyces sp. NBC_01477]